MMDGIQILSMTIENYRQYEGEKRINLACEGPEHINVIEGENGTGKSNLLNAITFCFFGEERHQDNNVEEDAQLPYASLNLLADLNSGESVEGHIEIRLGKNEPEYIFKREFKTFKTDDEYNDVEGDLDIKRKSGTDWESVGEANIPIVRNEILPPQVSQYFFFDGEQLQDFFSNSEYDIDYNYKERVESAIFDVSHIELLERSIDHLGTVRSDIESKASDFEGKPKEIKKEIEEFQEQKKGKEEELRNVSQDIEDTKKEIDRIDKKLRDVADDHVKGLYENRERLEGELQQKEKQLREQKENAKEVLLETGPLIYGEPAMEYANETLKQMSDKGQLPPKIRDYFIDELIEDGKCICGEEIESFHIENLEELRQEVTAVSEENLDGKAEIPALLDRTKESVERLLEARSRMSTTDGNLQNIKKNLRGIEEDLKAYDVPEEVDVPALENERGNLVTQRDDLIADRGVLKQEINDLESKIEAKEKELKDEMKKEKKFEEISNKLDFIDDVLGELKDIEEAILSDIREMTEENIETFYNDLIWKDQDYGIILKENYQIEVMNEHGENQLGSLSAGETQVLALSFMAALSQISGFEAPVVIDTPLGRISGDPKKLIAQNIPNYLENAQVTFLMTDQEYSSDVRGLMEGKVEHEYILDFEDGSTEVQSYA